MNSSLAFFTADFMLRFLINIAALAVLLRAIYFPKSRNSESYSGFFLFGCGVFLVASILHGVEISMGFAFGLFAIFSMLRYRTESLSIRDMVYLFVVIVIALISGVGPLTYIELLVLNGIVCCLAALSETSLFQSDALRKTIIYENIEHIHPDQYDQLHQELEKRTGLKIINIEIDDVDFLRDTAKLKISYKNIPKNIND